MNDRDYDCHFDYLKELEKIDDVCFRPTKESPTQMIYGDREEQYPSWAITQDLHELYTPEEIEAYEKGSKIEFVLNSPLYNF
jgi:hypothetical protein